MKYVAILTNWPTSLHIKNVLAIRNYFKHSLPDRRGIVPSSWNVMAHDDTREGKWRGNWRIEWVASTLHTTSEYGVSSITTADAQTSAAGSRLNWPPPSPPPIWTDSSVLPKDEIWFLRVCHHILKAVYNLMCWPQLCHRWRHFCRWANSCDTVWASR